MRGPTIYNVYIILKSNGMFEYPEHFLDEIMYVHVSVC